LVNPNKSRSKRKTQFSEEAIIDCIGVLESGDLEELFEIIPRIGVLRDSRFHEPLLALLRDPDYKKREFAAYAMGAMGSKEFLQPLQEAFKKVEKSRGSAEEELQLAIIEAIGAVGGDDAVRLLVPILKRPESSKANKKLRKWIVESLGAIGQQGGERSLETLLEITEHEDQNLRALAISELSVAFWHRPNELPESYLRRIHELTKDQNAPVAESALSALQSLADVGCRSAEKLFAKRGGK
jgi:hypothetical protein